MDDKPRNPLVDAFAEAMGQDIYRLTYFMANAINEALVMIQAVAPNLTPDEIKRRAFNFPTAKPKERLTPLALAQWWVQCDNPIPRNENLTISPRALAELRNSLIRADQDPGDTAPPGFDPGPG